MKTLAGKIVMLAIVGGGFYLYLQCKRYEIAASDKGMAYMIDRKTGQSWMLSGQEKVGHVPPRESERLSELPLLANNALKGRAGFREDQLGGNYGDFAGVLYNGSDWNVREVTFKITAKEKDGATRWERKYRTRIHMDALTSKEFRFQVIEERGAEVEWRIDSARGTRAEGKQASEELP